MGFLNYIAPFYISRYRLKLLAGRVGRGGLKLAGKLQIPGIGEFQIDYERVDSGTGAMLERVVEQMDKDNAIGDPKEGDRRFGWVWLKGKIAWVQDAQRGVDHLVAADLDARIPSKWRCLLVGSRANLTSLVETELPFLGSSPIAIQTAIEVFAERAGRPLNYIGAVQSGSVAEDTCQHLLRSAETISDDPVALGWDMVGLVEIIARCTKNQLILGAPLFLAYYSSKLPHQSQYPEFS
jgi:hypothetical protein